MKKYRITAVLAAFCLILTVGLLSGCGGGFTLTIENTTGYVLSDIRIAGENAGEWGSNRLGGNLADTETATVDLGTVNDEDTVDGFGIQIFDAYDNSIGSIRNVYLSSGDTVTLYFSDGNLCVLVNGETPSSESPDAVSVEPVGGMESELAGDWYNDAGTICLTFDGEGGYTMTSSEGSMETGNYTYDGTTITYDAYDENGDIQSYDGTLDSDGNLSLSTYADIFTKTEG